MFIDTHCHLNIMVKKEFDSILEENHYIHIEKIVNEAIAAGVTNIVNVGTSVSESLNSIKIAQQFKAVYATAGIHPCDTREDWRVQFEKIKGFIKQKELNRIVAIGETGLDFYHKPFNKQRQIDCFKAHIELALANQLPVIVHVRDSADLVLRVLEEYSSEIRGVNHCFQQDKYVADQLIKWGFYLGINAPITYPKNESFRELLKLLPLENIILETDSPFLPPQQFRGQQNQPKYIPLFAQVLADIKHVALEELGRVTSINAKKLFNI